MYISDIFNICTFLAAQHNEALYFPARISSTTHISNKRYLETTPWIGLLAVHHLVLRSPWRLRIEDASEPQIKIAEIELPRIRQPSLIWTPSRPGTRNWSLPENEVCNTWKRKRSSIHSFLEEKITASDILFVYFISQKYGRHPYRRRHEGKDALFLSVNPSVCVSSSEPEVCLWCADQQTDFCERWIFFT